MNLPFNTIEEVEIAIEEFASLNSDDYEEIKNSFFKLFGNYTLPVIHFKTNTLSTDSGVFRARPVGNIKDKTNISEFSYPPLNLKTPIQRANWLGRNVFYASDVPYTAIVESKQAHNGNEFYIAHWGYKLDKINLETIPIVTFAIDNVSPDNPWKQVLKSENDFYNLFKKEMAEKDANIAAYFISKISSLFTKTDETKYHLTAFLADYSLYQTSKNKSILYFPILIYPSIESSSRNCNFAIHPSFVNNYMYITKVIKVKITNKTSNGFRIAFSEIGIPVSKDLLKWYNFDIDKKETKFMIDSITCECGYKFDLSNIEGLRFKKGKSIYNHFDIVKSALQKFDFNDLYQLDKIFDNKELPIANKSSFKYRQNGLCLSQNEIEHTNLTINISVIQPIKYIEKKVQ